MNNSTPHLFQKIEHNQTFYHLSCIQNVGQSIPAAMVGKLLLNQFGAGTAICSIFVGNIILWLIGLAIISMVYQERTNAIDNIKGYLGKYGSLTFALALIAAFLAWYVNQINASLIALKDIPQFKHLLETGFEIRLGATLGLLSAILAIGGIRLLKWLTVLTFPFLACYCMYAIFMSNYSPIFKSTWGLSISAVIMVVLLNLPGVINLPTFFRHSRSRADSFLALSCMAIFITFFEFSTIWMDFSTIFEFVGTQRVASSTIMQIIPFTFFLILTSTCSNMLNIYLASACYESFIPKFYGTKGLAIMGLLGTTVYTFIQISSPIIFTINLLNNYIGVMGIVLLIAVLSRLVIQHRPRTFEKSINFASWLMGCAVSTILEIQAPDQSIHSLFYGMSASALFFLAIFFIEETVWSIQKLKSKRFEG